MSRERSKVTGEGGTVVKSLVTAAALIVSSTGITLAQDVEKGATLFKQCAVCHKIGPGATNSIGPELNGLDGRHSGSVANYSYSDANKNSGIVWNEETFKEYIKDPKANGWNAGRTSSKMNGCMV
jgi:cytochrome c